MEKQKNFNADIICVEDNNFVLKHLTAEDREYYFELYEENSVLKDMNDFHGFMEWNWNLILEEDSIYVSVFRKVPYQYVGNIVLQNLKSKTPEIGIDICKKYKRQGIASYVLPMFTNKISEIQEIEYFLVRIYSDNYPSICLFKKLGAVEFGNEPSEYRIILNELKEKYDDDTYKEIIGNPLESEAIADERCIRQYKLYV